MRNLILILALFMMTATSAIAAPQQKYVVVTTLFDTESMSNGVAEYSEAIDVSRNEGFMTLLVTENKAGGAGDVDISLEWSINGNAFYTAYTTDNNGSITADGNVVTTLGNVTRYIVVPARLAKYMRVKVDPDADSQVTMYMLWQI